MIVLADQQVFTVQSENSGRIGKIAVATGDDVSAQDVLAELSQSDLEIRISVAREAVDDLETKFEALNDVNGGAKRDHLGGVRRDRLAAAGLSP